MRFLSLFSGIEAASVAWHPLGWECVGVAEIEKFPSAVLAHHYPNTPNLGDVTKITERDIAALGRIDLVVFGSPCQDMSIAGKRKGLLNADGTVTRSGLFFTAFNIFQWARKNCGARFALWENVPGAYSSNQGRDFASVVEFMAGLDDVAVPSNGWGNEGCAVGDHGMLEWACLDAQWFGVAQRRRRVFAVLDTGDWANRPPILLERQSLRRDSAPLRQSGQDAAGTVEASIGRGRGAGRPAGLIEGGQLARCLTTKTRIDAETETLIPTIGGVFSFDGQASQHGVAQVFSTSGAGYWLEGGDGRRTGALSTGGGKPGQGQPVVCVSEVIGCDGTIDGPVPPLMARSSRGGAQTLSPGHQTDGHMIGVCVTGEITHTLKAEGFDASEDGTGRGQPIVAADVAFTLRVPSNGAAWRGDGADNFVGAGMAVRRLTPVECARLQGFPDDYLSSVIYRGKAPADGNMYKALGNSMCTNVMHWIRKRINEALIHGK